jgi:hypothetical protein
MTRDLDLVRFLSTRARRLAISDARFEEPVGSARRARLDALHARLWARQCELSGFTGEEVERETLAADRDDSLAPWLLRAADVTSDVVLDELAQHDGELTAAEVAVLLCGRGSDGRIDRAALSAVSTYLRRLVIWGKVKQMQPVRGATLFRRAFDVDPHELRSGFAVIGSQLEKETSRDDRVVVDSAGAVVVFERYRGHEVEVRIVDRSELVGRRYGCDVQTAFLSIAR